MTAYNWLDSLPDSGEDGDKNQCNIGKNSISCNTCISTQIKNQKVEYKNYNS